ncbi:hypothetical protein KFL_011160010 [Klebsormidium nitens]|uniref:DNA-directed primase/polymerase protein n=1 Tax=Klebsormidium nitens TaxID=105231 RepID=A0A1Y1IT62_KLENI|nr:hypothetical protein KFL_011160010 [Klebsormidium nitens]|eukprot:GAQ92739.1 hypothetical protein KFL_011160010 [Klebsormidium nitens]
MLLPVPEPCPIKQGRRANLFYDLEYMKNQNPGLSADDLVDTILAVTEDVCREAYGTGIWKERVVELDASYSTKFSRHLIVPIFGRCFSNVHEEMKDFVDKNIKKQITWSLASLVPLSSTPLPPLHHREPVGHAGAKISSRIIINEGFLSYSFKGTKFCYNVNRHHTQNNMYMVVDLQQGHFYQKCHDDVCQAMNFKGPFTRLPEGLLYEARAAVSQAVTQTSTKKKRAWGELEDMNPDFAEAIKPPELSVEKSTSLNPGICTPKTPDDLVFPLRLPTTATSPEESRKLSVATQTDERVIEATKTGTIGGDASEWGGDAQPLEKPRDAQETPGGDKAAEGGSTQRPPDAPGEAGSQAQHDTEPIGAETSEWGGDTQPLTQPFQQTQDAPGEAKSGDPRSGSQAQHDTEPIGAETSEWGGDTQPLEQPSQQPHNAPGDAESGDPRSGSQEQHDTEPIAAETWNGGATRSRWSSRPSSPMMPRPKTCLMRSFLIFLILLTEENEADEHDETEGVEAPGGKA